MTSATAILRREHDAILRMLEATEELSRRLDRSEPVPAETLGELLEFFRVFADRCHHGKEEDLLFPLLERKGMPRAGGPLGVMLAEHDEGRGLVRQLAESADAYRQGESTAGRRWAKAARAYATLLRQHIDKENNVLFPMAENLLSDAEQQELAAAFDEVEEKKIGAGTHQRLHAMMEKLTAEILS